MKKKEFLVRVTDGNRRYSQKRVSHRGPKKARQVGVMNLLDGIFPKSLIIFELDTFLLALYIGGRSHITSAAGGGRGGKPKADNC